MSERCSATAWTSGERCRNAAYYSDGLCGVHHSKAVARRDRRELEALRKQRSPDDTPKNPKEWLQRMLGEA